MVLPYLTDPLVHVPLRLGSYSDHQGQQRDKASNPKSENSSFNLLGKQVDGAPQESKLKATA